MSNDNVYERLFKLWAMVAKLVLDGKRSAYAVAKVLQAIVNESVHQFELYLHPKQKEKSGWIKGFDLDQHLRETGLYERTLSLENPEVKGWLEHPETYPEEYKNKAIFLWKSQQDPGDDRRVAYLVWHDGRVIVCWLWLGIRWSGFHPVLLASRAEGEV